jgi:hypothetical protein
MRLSMEPPRTNCLDLNTLAFPSGSRFDVHCIEPVRPNQGVASRYSKVPVRLLSQRESPPNSATTSAVTFK